MTPALKSLGAEVVKGDTADTASLTEAFKGAYGVFGVTGKFVSQSLTWLSRPCSC